MLGPTREAIPTLKISTWTAKVATEVMVPLRITVNCLASPAVAWEGELPANDRDGLEAKGFIPVEVDAGDLVVFPGIEGH